MGYRRGRILSLLCLIVTVIVMFLGILLYHKIGISFSDIIEDILLGVLSVFCLAIGIVSPFLIERKLKNTWGSEKFDRFELIVALVFGLPPLLVFIISLIVASITSGLQ